MKGLKMKIFVILLSLLVAYPSGVDGLRNLKVGDKLPLTEAMEIFIPGQPKLLLCMNSGREQNEDFFNELVSEIGENADLKFFLIDTNQELEGRIAASYDALKFAKQLVPDKDKKIFGDLGIIVLPTLIFVTKENVLHSYIAGYHSNLNLEFRSYLDAFAKGVPPENLAEKAEKTMEDRQISKLLTQGFQLMTSQNYDLAHLTFQKAWEIDSDNEGAILGIGYALLFMDKVDESLGHFAELVKTSDSPRAQLGYYLCLAVSAPSEETSDKIASLSLLEPRYFFVIYKAAEILEKAGRHEESTMAYKKAYDVLLRLNRRIP